MGTYDENKEFDYRSVPVPVPWSSCKLRRGLDGLPANSSLLSAIGYDCKKNSCDRYQFYPLFDELLPIVKASGAYFLAALVFGVRGDLGRLF